jgi:AMIN domain
MPVVWLALSIYSAMEPLPRLRSQLIALSLFAGWLTVSVAAQSSPQLLASTDLPVVVRSVRVLSGQTGPVVEILSDRPLVPIISKLDNPPRLVIDLPNTDLPSALVSGSNKPIDFPSEDIRRIRVNQYQSKPPIARVVVDLLKPVGQTWDAAGNRLMVRLHPAHEVTAKPPSVPAFTQGIQPVAVPLGPGSSGALVLAGSHAAAGSSVTAGSDTSVLRLERGGEVLVCPGTTVSVTSAQKGHALMLGMNTGALEAHYSLDASADSILTPDFRILLAGPGEFHYAVSADSRGNTCVRALPGNTASVIVAELLGDGNYQVKPTEQIVFHSGRLNLVDTAVPVSCGCPPPATPMLRASTVPASAISDASLPSSTRLAQPGDELKSVALATSRSVPQLGSPSTSQVTVSVFPPETAALPPSNPNDVHVQVEAPFVFRASDVRAQPPLPKPTPIREAELLQVTDLPRPATYEIEVLPPPQTPTRQHHGVFAKIRGFFATIFG